MENGATVVDMRNHGLSFWADSHSYEDLACDLRNVIREFGVKAHVIGHSMGGKAAMVLSLLHPECVESLIVVDIAPAKYRNSHRGLISALESIDLNLINTINKHILSNFKVSFTFLNLVNHKNMIRRLKLRKSINRYDNFKKSFYNKVQKGFIKLSNKNKKKYQIINSNLDIKLNEKLILKRIEKLIK